MTDPSNSYTTQPFPVARKLIMDTGRWGTGLHLVYALLEVDVTRMLILPPGFISATSYKSDTFLATMPIHSESGV